MTTAVQLLTVPRAAERFSVSAATLRKWIKTGKLTAYDKTLGQLRPVWLVSEADMMALLSQHRKIVTYGRRSRGPSRETLARRFLRSRGIL